MKKRSYSIKGADTGSGFSQSTDCLMTNIIKGWHLTGHAICRMVTVMSIGEVELFPAKQENNAIKIMRADFPFMLCLGDKNATNGKTFFSKKCICVLNFYLFIHSFPLFPPQSTTTPMQNSRDSSKISGASDHHMTFHILNV